MPPTVALPLVLRSCAALRYQAFLRIESFATGKATR